MPEEIKGTVKTKDGVKLVEETRTVELTKADIELRISIRARQIASEQEHLDSLLELQESDQAYLKSL